MDCQDPCFTAKFQLLVQPRSQVFLLLAPEGQVRENPGNNVVTCSTCITSIPGSCFAPPGAGRGGRSTGVKFPFPLCGREMKDPGSRLPHALLWSTAHHWKQPHKQLSLNPKLFTLKLSHIINSQMFEIVHYVKCRGITKRLGRGGLICLQTSMYKYDYN